MKKMELLDKPKLLVPLPAVTEARAVGNMVLFEEIGEAELLGTTIELVTDKNSKQQVPHEAFILDIGPMVDKEKYGYDIGDRVVVNGAFSEMPKATWKNGRKIGSIDPGGIKAKLS